MQVSPVVFCLAFRYICRLTTTGLLCLPPGKYRSLLFSNGELKHWSLSSRSAFTTLKTILKLSPLTFWLQLSSNLWQNPNHFLNKSSGAVRLQLSLSAPPETKQALICASRKCPLPYSAQAQKPWYKMSHYFCLSVNTSSARHLFGLYAFGCLLWPVFLASPCPVHLPVPSTVWVPSLWFCIWVYSTPPYSPIWPVTDPTTLQNVWKNGESPALQATNSAGSCASRGHQSSHCSAATADFHSFIS